MCVIKIEKACSELYTHQAAQLKKGNANAGSIFATSFYRAIANDYQDLMYPKQLTHDSTINYDPESVFSCKDIALSLDTIKIPENSNYELDSDADDIASFTPKADIKPEFIVSFTDSISPVINHQIADNIYSNLAEHARNDVANHILYSLANGIHQFTFTTNPPLFGYLIVNMRFSGNKCACNIKCSNSSNTANLNKHTDKIIKIIKSDQIKNITINIVNHEQ